jgi:small subunit ribosomal protein S24e
MTYILFGAYQVESAENGFTCDDWLPVIGNTDTLDDIRRLKTAMETCMLRVFEGISAGRRVTSPAGRPRTQFTYKYKEEESESEDGADGNEPSWTDRRLRDNEIRELDDMTSSIVGVLERYSDERVQTQTRYNSRPGTPFGGPPSRHNSRPGTPFGGNNLTSQWDTNLFLPPALGGSSRSGYNTPTAFSRPSSRLSTRW